MRVERGRKRIVIILGGFAIKFPRVRIFKAIEFAWHAAWDREFVRWWKKGYDPDFVVNIQSYLLGGVFDNWSEFVFFRKNQLAFLAPTILSFLGLLNIQKSGQEFKMKDEIFLSCLSEITDGEIFVDAHTFSNPKNFCVFEGRLRIVDYASCLIWDVLKKYGNKIYDEFEFDLDSE